jgi:hypothetical protein
VEPAAVSRGYGWGACYPGLDGTVERSLDLEEAGSRSFERDFSHPEDGERGRGYQDYG